jgi:hypothetical protein
MKPEALSACAAARRFRVPLLRTPTGRGEELGELPDVVRQISHLVSDDIGLKVFDRRGERRLVEEIAQDRSDPSGAEPR